MPAAMDFSPRARSDKDPFLDGTGRKKAAAAAPAQQGNPTLNSSGTTELWLFSLSRPIFPINTAPHNDYYIHREVRTCCSSRCFAFALFATVLRLPARLRQADGGTCSRAFKILADS
jgi:hypothetical protein